MYNKKKSALIRLLAMVMVIISVIPVGANAAIATPVQPYASSYLDSYGAYVYPAGGGLVQVWFHVDGTGIMDELGVLSISIYESANNSTWTWKKTFTHDSTSGMLGYDDFYHSGHIDYQGVAGRYYKAYICVWGGEGGEGDTRYFWTSSKKAT